MVLLSMLGGTIFLSRRHSAEPAGIIGEPLSDVIAMERGYPCDVGSLLMSECLGEFPQEVGVLLRQVCAGEIHAGDTE